MSGCTRREVRACLTRKPVANFSPRVLAGLAALAAAALASGCADRAYNKAVSGERDGRYSEAAGAYKAFAGKYASDLRAAEALVRSAWIYHRIFSRCREAQPLYEQAIREHPKSPWAAVARDALLDCPEYFPVRDGMSWTYVDTASGGKIMRLEIKASAARPSGPGADLAMDGMRGRVSGARYAGAERVEDYRRIYVKQDWHVWEVDAGERLGILRYPFQPGSTWTGRQEGKEVTFTIEADSATVTVLAGTFAGCLKVREFKEGLEGWTYQYYAPGVGRVKTTQGAPDQPESPMSELKEYKLPPPGRL